MRCKPGDLAVIVKSNAGNEGTIVKVVHYIGNPGGCVWQLPHDYWEIDTNIKSKLGYLINFTHDSYMRPLRESDGQDETLTWAKKPEKLCVKR